MTINKISEITVFISYVTIFYPLICTVLFPCSLKIGLCSLVPFNILPMFPCSPKPLGEPLCSAFKRKFSSFLAFLKAVTRHFGPFWFSTKHALWHSHSQILATLAPRAFAHRQESEGSGVENVIDRNN